MLSFGPNLKEKTVDGRTLVTLHENFKLNLSIAVSLLAKEMGNYPYLGRLQNISSSCASMPVHLQCKSTDPPIKRWSLSAYSLSMR